MYEPFYQYIQISNGWICKDHNSIVCPYHALEFDGQGRFLKEGLAKGEPIAKALNLIVDGDLIWTYGGFTPQIEIPSLLSERMAGTKFLGIAGDTHIHAKFLDCIRINYDFNHQNGVHRDTFRIRDNPVQLF